MKIYKYEIPIQDKFTLMLPLRAKILSFQMQNYVPNIWCLVNPSANLFAYKFELYGTGHEIIEYERLKYIGTVQSNDNLFGNQLVWHLFQDLSN